MAHSHTYWDIGQHQLTIGRSLGKQRGRWDGRQRTSEMSTTALAKENGWRPAAVPSSCYNLMRNFNSSKVPIWWAIHWGMGRVKGIDKWARSTELLCGRCGLTWRVHGAVREDGRYSVSWASGQQVDMWVLGASWGKGKLCRVPVGVVSRADQCTFLCVLRCDAGS